MNASLKNRIKNPLIRALLLGLMLYLLIGVVFCAGSLYCYNVRNWDTFGGFSLPPLFAICFFSDIILWPVYLWANLINGLGVFGNCPLP